MDARSQHDEHDTMAPAAMVEQLLTEIAPTTTPRKGRNLPGVERSTAAAASGG